MQEIADWLEKLGMSEYAQRLAEHGVEFSALSDLTDAVRTWLDARGLADAFRITPSRT